MLEQGIISEQTWALAVMDQVKSNKTPTVRLLDGDGIQIPVSMISIHRLQVWDRARTSVVQLANVQVLTHVTV